jgi:hypothetical protein
MIRHLEGAGYRVIQHRNFTILHSEISIVRQINVARSKLPFMSRPDSLSLRTGMKFYLDDLE